MRVANRDPMNPAPPVTRYVGVMHLLRESECAAGEELFFFRAVLTDWFHKVSPVAQDRRKAIPKGLPFIGYENTHSANPPVRQAFFRSRP